VNSLRITLVYGSEREAKTETLELPEGSTLSDALQKSQLALAIDPDRALSVAVFGQLCGLSQTLADGDRIELLRPLVIDAKEARRRRVAVRERRQR
jgi:putative ubiquitin-RnfH superfamily antitoxin RatB of RatAB toxin-antitoxin module